MVGQEIASINSKIDTVITEMNPPTERIAKIEQGLQTDKQQKQLTETLQKLETASFNSKTLDLHLYTVLNYFLDSFKQVSPNSNFNQYKHFIKQRAEDANGELISITKSISLY